MLLSSVELLPSPRIGCTGQAAASMNQRFSGGRTPILPHVSRLSRWDEYNARLSPWTEYSTRGDGILHAARAKGGVGKPSQYRIITACSSLRNGGGRLVSAFRRHAKSIHRGCPAAPCTSPALQDSRLRDKLRVTRQAVGCQHPPSWASYGGQALWRDENLDIPNTCWQHHLVLPYATPWVGSRVAKEYQSQVNSISRVPCLALLRRGHADYLVP